MKTRAAIGAFGLFLCVGCGERRGGGNDAGTGGAGDTATTGAGGEGAGPSSTAGTGGGAHSGGGGAGATSTSGAGASGGGGGLPACPPPIGESFTSVVIIGPPEPSPSTQPDVNVKVRGWVPSNAALELVDVGGDTDPKAPKLPTMIEGRPLPEVVENRSVRQWDWATNQAAEPIAYPEATMTGFRTAPGDVMRLPHSGYEIAPGLEATVIFLDEDSITLKYTPEDNVVVGYAIHVVGVCLEPALVARYQADDAAGRTQLPALSFNQAFARARNDRVFVAIRDTGSFMDPRTRKDWW